MYCTVFLSPEMVVEMHQTWESKDVSARIGQRIRKETISLIVNCIMFNRRSEKEQPIDVGAARPRQQPVRLKVSLAMHRLHTMRLGSVELI